MKPVPITAELLGEAREKYLLPCRGLKLIGIRFYPYPGTDRETKRKAMCIQKNLYDSTDWLYFNKGFSITDYVLDNPKAAYIEVEDYAFDSTFLLYSDELKISFSAIIGQNGTGKSTIVDTVIRLINNFAAAIIGEGYVYSSAQHLHYIENVYASLAVYVDNKVRILTCKGDKLYVSTYEANMRELADKDSDAKERYSHAITTDVLYGNEPKNVLLPPQNKLRYLLKDWFYTMVGNYSLYAYNYRDYLVEKTSRTKLELLRKIRPEDNKEEDEYWLKGVFHKNDGYQTPVVIHPMRKEGYVDAAQVNYLGKKNLISLAFEKSAHPERGGDKFPFRVINQTHHLVGFYFYPPEVDEYDHGFIEGIMKAKLDLTDEQKKRFGEIEKPIKEFWAKSIGTTIGSAPLSIREKRAWDYVAYKTIKIFGNYKHYQEAWNNLEGALDKKRLEAHLETLQKDSSHRTLKLRQTLAFLRFCNEDDYYMRKGFVVDLDDIYAWMSGKVGEQLYLGKDYHRIEIDDLLPPPYPITDVVLQLVDNDHLEEYKAIKNLSLNIIPFEGLSAGERQIAYTLGNIVYHLKNIESAKQDFNNGPHHLESLKYDYINILLDEVELYFHPDLQRRFVCLLVDAIKGLKLDSTSGINVTLITHSPFVLSDIPSENVMFLTRDKEDKLEGNTFAANIHDLFNNTFFLPYTVGELARKEISDIVELYNDWRANQYRTAITVKGDKGWSINKQELCSLIKRRGDKMKYIASVIGDDYLQGELTDMLEEMGTFVKRRWDNEEN